MSASPGQRIDLLDYDGSTSSYKHSLCYYKNRWYSPEMGRFMSNDPAGYVDSFNLYQYARGRAIIFVDPLGFGSYSIGECQEPTLPEDNDFPYNSKDGDETLDDYLSWYKWGVYQVGAHVVRWDLSDATEAYRRYRDGSGEDLEVDYEKAYEEDSAIKQAIDAEIASAKSAAERLWDGKVKSFNMYGSAERIGNPATENWQKTIGQHTIYGCADVEVVCGSVPKFIMSITIHERDKYNFNRDAEDIATGEPDNDNGRFEELGWAKSFNTTGSVSRIISWKKGDATSSELNENNGR